jgi:hypothetical protein
MDEAHWQELLIQGGVAPRRARRAVREFAEHRSDIIRERLQLGETAAEGMITADARLGSPRLLVEAMLARPELKSWSRRRPWAAFTVAPLLTFCALFAGLSLATIVFLSCYKSAVGDLRSAPLVTRWVTDGAAFLVLWGTPVVVGALLALVALQRRECSRWPAGGIVLVCVLGALTNFEFVLPPTSEPPQLSIGIGFSSASLMPALTRAALTGALTLLPYAWARRIAGARSLPGALT